MADTVKQVEYYYTEAADRPGAGAKVLGALQAGRVNLLAFTGFPTPGGRAQLDLVPEHPRRLLQVAERAGIKLVGPKTAFLAQGGDRIGAVAEIAAKLAGAKINVTAMTAIAAGRRRYGVVLWVKPRQVKRAAAVLGAT